jgi:hypothetical protein
VLNIWEEKMKKLLGITLAFFALFALIGCAETTTAAPTTIFALGTETGNYAPTSLSGWEVTKTVYLQIMGPNDTELFNGTVTVVSTNPTFYEAFVGACTSAGIAQSSATDSGFITSVDSYVNGTNSMYWMGYINGESLLVGSNSSQIRNGDYLQLVFEAVSW